MGATQPGAGDLGRRLVARRDELGMSRAEVAELAGMDTGYLAYLEERTGHPTSGAVFRLAHALRTTPEQLLGGAAGHPPGRGAPAARPRLTSLSTEECWRLLDGGGVGRVVLSTVHGPVAFPVNFTVERTGARRAVLLRTARDSELAAHLGHRVGFEVDQVDEVRREGWSVLISGQAHRAERSAVDPAPTGGGAPQAWAGADRELLVRVEAERVTGRRLLTR